MSDILFVLIILCAVGSGLNAGLFFIFSNTIMSAFGQIKPHEGIAAMQSINRVILNPVFFSIFIGTAILSALSIILLIWNWENPGSFYVLLGAIIYIVGCLVVTILFNVPRNEALDKEAPESKEAAELWKKYLVEWTMWNHVRTVACILSLVSFLFAFRYW